MLLRVLVDVMEAILLHELHCTGRQPPFWAFKRPARPRKNTMEKNRFTTANATGAWTPRAGPRTEAGELRADVIPTVADLIRGPCGHHAVPALFYMENPYREQTDGAEWQAALVGRARASISPTSSPMRSLAAPSRGR